MKLVRVHDFLEDEIFLVNLTDDDLTLKALKEVIEDRGTLHINHR